MEVRTAAIPEGCKALYNRAVERGIFDSVCVLQRRNKLVYSHNDRIIVGGIMPVEKKLMADGLRREIRAEYFLQRRELV